MIESGGKMKKQSKAVLLQKENDEYKKQIQTLEEVNQRLLNNGEYSLFNSPTYYTMKEKIEFLEAVSQADKINIKNLEADLQKSKLNIEQVKLDNSRLMEHSRSDEGYFIGITDCEYDTKEYYALKLENRGLQGNIKALKEELDVKVGEISALQEKIGQLQWELVHMQQKQNKNEETDQQLTISDVQQMDHAIKIIEQELEQERKNREHVKSKAGRPPKIDAKAIAMISELYKKGYSMRAIASKMGCSVGSVHRLIKKDT